MGEALQGCRVLVVEDEAAIALDLRGILQGEGCTVVGPEARVEQALRRAAEEPIDAAVLDVNLEGETGFAVADALAARGVPFLFLTGYERSILPERFRDRPLQQKPFSSRRLVATLKAALGR